MIRSHLVRALYKNLLGPRDGNRELIEQPFLQYQMGILNSSVATKEESGDARPAIDSEINPEPAEVSAEVLPDRRFSEDAQDFDSFRQETDTDLSLKTGAVSMGLHFVLKGDAPRFKICLTWARYEQAREFGDVPRMFNRRPNFYVTGWIDANSNDTEEELKNGVNGSVVTCPGARLHVIKRRIKNSDRWIVKIFLENATRYGKSQKEEDRIFQPQIRVVSYGRAELLDLDLEHGQGEIGDSEMEELLYRKHRAKARGYMCAAVWAEVDPGGEDGSEIGSISWPDAESVPKSVRREFAKPLVRTEYMPLYTVLQPDQSDTFDACGLSHAWDPEDIELKLAPIEAGYSEWIEDKKGILAELEVSDTIKSRGEKNLQNCDKTRLRIRNGIDFLKSSEKARAAFCFMNAVMNDKRLNEKRENLPWREFQMAFILQSLRGVSGESEAERALADVLWFPTGGGKTEAYLGIVIFAIAYRRLTPGDARSNDGGVSVISRYTLRLLTIQQFQRALGAIVAADVRRVENWLPEGALDGNRKITDPHMLKCHSDGSLWGNQRFSIGIWIGSEVTPNDFAHRAARYGVVLNCEGALLSHEDEIRKRPVGKENEPAQVQACPVCKSLLCLPKTTNPGKSRKMTWIVRSPKTAEWLNAIPQAALGNHHVTVRQGPEFVRLGPAQGNSYFFRLTMEISPKMRSQSLSREAVDKWWKEAVAPNLDPSPNGSPLLSTSPSMPGYFFLQQPRTGRPHDFAIFCTDGECKLNKTEWFERLENSHSTLVPEPFQVAGGRSNSVPISAYTVDEQIYLKCPSLLIGTVDKFARLPFEPKCASLFGNVDAVHPVYGYGRRFMFEAPLRSRNRSIKIGAEELHDVAGFNPPSLILQDELHLIEGPLGSMVGAYEMAVDVLSDNGLKPKYIASSATIKEAESQMGTIFRRSIETFPPQGIDSTDSYFSKIREDVGCAEMRPGRLYLGIATTKTTVTLPIRAQSIVMSEIFKIRANPDKYDLTEEEKDDIGGWTDPYWTFVSYFTDLQLLSKFTDYYSEEIIGYVGEWSVEKAYNSRSRTPNSSMGAGLRLFALRADQDMEVSGVSVYCANGAGWIRLAVYRDGDPVGHLEHKFIRQTCRTGENTFTMPNPASLHIEGGEKIWIAVINDSESAVFQTVASMEKSWEGREMGGAPDDFPESCTGLIPFNGNAPKISLNSPSRQLETGGNVTLYSETKSEELATNLQRLESEFEVDSLQTSPVFGTGIDVDRLGIMEVMNQPKTSSGYIQSTGRVGRMKPGLVISWLRAGRIRDLNHYENFVGYHRALHRFVEPMTASPFSSKAMGLCLGPIIVAILRNARSVMGPRVSQNWVGGVDGARNMANAHDAPDICAVGRALGKIASSGFIAKNRNMHSEEFKRIFEQEKARWRGLAEDMASSTGPSFQYSESSLQKEPSKNVVLGSPNHKDMGLEYAYENTPISLRQTEPSATLYRDNDTVPIRPSQFTTRYGPGSLVSGKTATWVVPSIRHMVGNLRGRGNFNSPNNQGHLGLHKYEVDDSRMKRILHRLHPNTSQENLRLFSLPTNSSLTIKENEGLYNCNNLSNWFVCYNSAHTSKVLVAAQHNGAKWVVKCPECQRASDSADSPKFYGVRYAMACKGGHLGDVAWEYEVHRDVGSCDGNVFEWRASGGNDNVEIVCVGHWSGNNFVRSRCGGSIDHIELKRRSKNGEMACSARFAEENDEPNGCERVNGRSLAKMVSKTQMSLRMPIVSTSMEIQGYSGTLVEYYKRIAGEIDGFMYGREGVSKDDFVAFLERQSQKNRRKFTRSLIRQTVDASDRDVFDAIDETTKTLTEVSQEQTRLTERQSLEDELSSLERQTRDRGTGPQVGPNDPPLDKRFPIGFPAMGIKFEAMPFGDIKVTQVQTGYTREISPPVQQDVQPEQNAMLRKGDAIRTSSRWKDPNGNIWYVANQLVGEGVFIHLDPKIHDDGADVLGKSSESTKTWWRIHEETRERNEPVCKALKEKEGHEQEIDAYERETMLTNPLFVWWHSFAHELINQLAIDSGFMGASLGERIYCVTRRDNSYGAGVLIYATSPGADGTLGGLTSLVDRNVLRMIVEKTLRNMRSCSNDPLCLSRKRNPKRATGAACHACLMNSETSCAYQNKYLDRNVVVEALDS